MRSVARTFDLVERWLAGNRPSSDIDVKFIIFGFLTITSLPFISGWLLTKAFAWEEAQFWFEVKGPVIWVGWMATILVGWLVKLCMDWVNPERRRQHMRELDERTDG